MPSSSEPEFFKLKLKSAPKPRDYDCPHNSGHGDTLLVKLQGEGEYQAAFKNAEIPTKADETENYQEEAKVEEKYHQEAPKEDQYEQEQEQQEEESYEPREEQEQQEELNEEAYEQEQTYDEEPAGQNYEQDEEDY